MHIITPTEITSVAWEGELVAPAVSYALSTQERPVVTIGRPEMWTVAEALENQVGQKWTPPLGDADYWLVRLACTLRNPSGRQTITEAEQRLYLRPRNSSAGQAAAYAFSLFPDRLGVEDRGEVSASLGPELKFADGSGFSVGQLGARIECRQVFPVIQGYGAGESTPYWVFKPHAAHPLEGSQYVYAVTVARANAGGIRASVELVVTVETQFGPVRFGAPEEANVHTRFTIP
jgi:hypothetical protein